MQKVDMVKVDARKLSINLGCIKKIPPYPPLRKGEVKELYTKPSILQLKKILNLGQVRIATKVRLEMFGLSRKNVRW